MRVLILLVFALQTFPFASLCDQCDRKCCPKKWTMNEDDMCVEGGPDFLVDDPKLKVVEGKLDCESYYLEESDNYTVYRNGTILFDNILRDYCRDLKKHNNTYNYTYYICMVEEDDPTLYTAAIFAVYSFGLYISLPFLVATFLVYAAIKKLRNLYGKCLLSHLGCMIVSYSVLGFTQTGYATLGSSCILTGYAIQFFFMATFFWLNVMCFDIYWGFSSLRKPTGSVKERERKKLILYSIYAWGSPLLILLITVGIDFSPAVPDSSMFKPRVGVDKCFFKEHFANVIYFYMPMGLIILSNIFLFSVTAYRICTIRRETAVLKRGDSRKHDNTNDKERFSLYLKLFLVMGINWVMELVSVLFGGPEYIWYIPDFTNTLQGVFIFIIFVWKKRVRRLVWAKLKSCCGKETISSRSKSPWSASARNTSSLTTSTGVQSNSVKSTPSNNIVMTPQTAKA